METLPKEPLPKGDWHEVRSHCISATQGVRSFYSRLLARDRTRKALAANHFILLDCWIEHVRPDRLHVLQQAWEQRDGVEDEWITIGSHHFENPFVWVQAQKELRSPFNEFIPLDKFLAVLRTGTLASAFLCKPANLSYFLLRFEKASVEVPDSPRAPVPVDILVDGRTRQLVKGVIDITEVEGKGQPGDSTIEQVFAGYDADIQINAPTAQTLVK